MSIAIALLCVPLSRQRRDGKPVRRHLAAARSQCHADGALPSAAVSVPAARAPAPPSAKRDEKKTEKKSSAQVQALQSDPQWKDELATYRNRYRLAYQMRQQPPPPPDPEAFLRKRRERSAPVATSGDPLDPLGR